MNTQTYQTFLSYATLKKSNIRNITPVKPYVATILTYKSLRVTPYIQ